MQLAIPLVTFHHLQSCNREYTHTHTHIHTNKQTTTTTTTLPSL